MTVEMYGGQYNEVHMCKGGKWTEEWGILTTTWAFSHLFENTGLSWYEI